MKTVIFFFSIILLCGNRSFAQCGKKLVLSASETTYLDSTGTVKKTVNEKSVVQINPAEIIISINDEHRTTCTIKSTTCNWTVPFKQGKTVVNAVFSQNSENKNVRFDIEGKDGKVTLLFKMEERPDEIIKVVLNKFEEEKG